MHLSPIRLEWIFSGLGLELGLTLQVYDVKVNFAVTYYFLSLKVSLNVTSAYVSYLFPQVVTYVLSLQGLQYHCTPDTLGTVGGSAKLLAVAAIVL